MIPSITPISPMLMHQPYGEQHPYIPLPYERSPRDPIAGEPVTLGVETGHDPAADSVWCLWRLAVDPVFHRVEALDCTKGETSDTWKIQLPAFNSGDIVSYRIFSTSKGADAQTEEFSFSVSGWVEAVSVAAVEQNSERLVVKLNTDRQNLVVWLVIAPNASNTLSLSLTASSEKISPKSILAMKEQITTAWDDLSITITGNPLKLAFARQSDALVLQSLGPIRVLLGADGKVLKYNLGFMSPDDEAFYGFGERFNALDQRGNILDNYVYGQYTSQEKRSYIPIPFFISSRGYGLWLNTDRQAEFDMAANEHNRWAITGHAEEEGVGLKMEFLFQQHPHEIVQAFTDLTGKPKLPPAWTFGLWMSSNDWNSQAEVIHQLELAQRHQIPATVLVIEAWSDEINFYIWNDAQYKQQPASQFLHLKDYRFPAEGRWPDPKSMIDELHKAGLRLVLWQNPTIKFGEARENLDETLNKVDQAYAIEHGYVVTKADGSPHRVEAHMPWFRNSLVFDFTNPEAADWWFKKHEYLVTEMGVDGFKTDGGEHIWDPETRFSNGLRGTRGINTYPLDYESAYQRFMQSHRGEDFVLFSRAGYTGSQNTPCHWAGDENSTWDAFRASLRAMLNVGLCGVPFMGWDIAGFAGPLPSSELYLRAAAFSVFCPIMQYHSDVNHRREPSRDRTPWNIQEQTGDAEVMPFFQQFANLRTNLLPYILGQAVESSQSGLPLMRILPLEFPKDRQCREFPYEYMFGEALLVAPVTQEGITTWPVYLPQGEWRDLWTSELHHGPALIEMNVPRSRIPVFQKQGSILALNLDASAALPSPVGNRVDTFDHLTLRIFPAKAGAASTTLSTASGLIRVAVESSAQDGALSVSLPALDHSLDLVIFGAQPASVIVEGGPAPDTAVADWHWDAAAQATRIHLAGPVQASRIIIR